jgi:NAD(P)H-hydrate epimerase
MSEASFRTADGDPVTAVTAAEMRAVDRVAVEEVGLGLLQMMENAGRSLAWHARDLLADAGEGPVLVVAGGGGNGGGGLAAARHLANHGVDVTVALDRDPGTLEGGAARQHAVLSATNVPVAVGPDALGGADPAVVVDALVGYGLSGALREPQRTVVERVEDLAAPTLSLDVPSGLDATTGEVLGTAVAPDRTLTLALPKTGLADRPEALVLADIGIPAVVYERAGVDYRGPFGGDPWVALRGGD